MSVAQRFADNLARHRRLADMTQDEVAARAEIHRTEVSQLERGLRTPRIDTLAKLAAVLEVTPAELMDGIEWKPGAVRRGRFHDGGGAAP